MLTESDFRNMVTEAVKRILTESYYDEDREIFYNVDNGNVGTDENELGAGRVLEFSVHPLYHMVSGFGPKYDSSGYPDPEGFDREEFYGVEVTPTGNGFFYSEEDYEYEMKPEDVKKAIAEAPDDICDELGKYFDCRDFD